MMDKERVFDFLYGLNKDFDEVRGRVLGFKPFPEVKGRLQWSDEKRVGNGLCLEKERGQINLTLYNQNRLCSQNGTTIKTMVLGQGTEIAGHGVSTASDSSILRTHAGRFTANHLISSNLTRAGEQRDKEKIEAF